MSKKTKNQHHVPKCYLKRWKNEKNQIHVFDTRTESKRISNLEKVACERYFYDIDNRKISEQNKLFLKELGLDITSDDQVLEHYFAQNIETQYSNLLSKILSSDLDVFDEHKSYFISPQDKEYLAFYVAVQRVRTIQLRNDIKGISSMMKQVLLDMGAFQLLNQYVLEDEEERVVQGNMILNIDEVIKSANAYSRLTWILLVNNTSKKFYTSDNPIGTIAHVDHKYMSMSGIESKGVEVFFPLSPKYMLIMLDGKYHVNALKFERKCYIADDNDVEYYNRYSVLNSYRCVFSIDDNFSTINKMLEINPSLFKKPKMQLSWGGKDYFPE